VSNYWQKFSRQRIGRRRVLAAASSAGLGAAFLAACGGDDESSSPGTGTTGTTGSGATPSPNGGGTSPTGSTGGSATGASSSLLTPIVDETADVIRGGRFVAVATGDILGFDPHTTDAASGTVVEPTYSTLWLQKAGHLGRPEGVIEGDVVESWEISPDRLTITAKLNTNAHFSPLEPTNGRRVDAHDVLFSWERVLNLSGQAPSLANDLSPSAPIASMEAADDETLVINLAQPNATVLALLTVNFQGNMLIGPKEGADPAVLNLSTTSRGSGPWYLSENVPGVSYTFKRNPGFGQDERNVPYLDEVHHPVVPEYASALAQFRAGNVVALGTQGTGVAAEDILPLKRDVNELLVMQSDFQTPVMRPFFGVADSSPFKDQRLRQAFQMTWDRDLFADVYFNVDNFEKEGLAVETAWETALQSDAWSGWFLDGKSEDFGPNSRFLRQNLAEARKLVEAAGFPDGAPIAVKSPTNLGAQASFDRALEIVLGMALDSGLFSNEKREQMPWVPDFIQQVNSKKGQIDGVAFTQSRLTFDPTNYLRLWYHPAGQRVQGTDSTFEELLDRAVAEFDDQERMALIHEVQRHEAENVFFPRIAGATSFRIHWPALRNVNVWQGGTARNNCTVFLDSSKPPLA
jgi:ABC-type transport system substrate-binding protein